MPIFAPCPNKKKNLGLNRDRFLLNAALTENYHEQCFVFLGKFLGIGIRTGSTLPINLAPFIWKQLIGQTVTLQDVAAVDATFVEFTTQIRCIEAEGVDESSWDDSMDLTFVCQSSDGREVELIPNGRQVRVSFGRRAEFCDLAEQYRLQELRRQCALVRAGLATIVPIQVLDLFTATELEVEVCGKPDIDLQLLRKHTSYSGYSASDNAICILWEVLESFPSELRSAFLRFVWGRSRLPPAELFSTNFTITRLSRSDPDASFPIAHTCFFTVDMPEYTSFEAMRAKLLYAITECLSIDGDGSANASRQGNSEADWDDSDDDDE